MATANDTQGAEAGALDKGAKAVHETFEQLQTSLGKVEQALNDITSHWSGAAFAAFSNLITSWGNDAKAISKILIDLEDNLNGAESDRVQMEEEAEQTIKGLQGMMA